MREDIGQLIDLFPTILSICGVSYQGRFDGRDLFPSDEKPGELLTIAEYYYPRQVLSVFGPEAVERSGSRLLKYMRRLRAIQDGHFKLIWSSDGKHELYQIDQDAQEDVDLLIANPSHRDKERLLRMLEAFVKEHQGNDPLPPPPPVGWMIPGFEAIIDDPELLERLRSLGYVN